MTRKLVTVLLSCLLGAFALSAHADPWKDESDHRYGHKHKGGHYKEKYWDGPCKVERKWKGNGEYKQERKCKGHPPVYHHAPGAVYYEAEPAIVVSPQIVIRP